MKSIINYKIIKLLYINVIIIAFLFPAFEGVGGGLKAQTSEVLLNSTWTLHDAEVNGDPLPLSVISGLLNPDLSGVYSFEFYYGTTTCFESFKVDFTDVTETSFNLSTINEYVSCNYTDPDEIAAVELYLSFYYELPFDANSTPKNPFTYEWVDGGFPVEDLIISNPDGDWLLYRREFLSAPTFHQESFTLYPNPVKEALQIDNTSNLTVKAILFDLNGKLFQSHLIEAGQSQIDVKKLQSGLYFVVFESETGERVSKKFVKR